MVDATNPTPLSSTFGVLTRNMFCSDPMPGCNEKEKASDLPLAFSFYFASLSSVLRSSIKA